MPKSTTPSARERELYRYYQPCEVSGTSGPDGRHIPRSSNDPCLTAFTQLGALRMNTKRGLITMCTRDTEHILAESGKSLSLQKDDDENDPLWHGVGTLKEGGMGQHLMEMFCAPENAAPYAVFNDLSKHELFKDKPGVAEPPYVRFLASVPLRTPLHSMVIGTYIVADDQPRGGLSAGEIQFLTDMAVTIMDYLEAARINQKEYRAQRMVKAVGLFIERKSSLRDWWLQAGHKIQHSKVQKRVRNGDTLEFQADAEFGVQDPPDEFSANGIERPHHGLSQSLPRSPSSSSFSQVDRGDGRPMVPRGYSHFSESDTTVPPSLLSRPGIDHNGSVTTFDAADDLINDVGGRNHSVNFDLLPEQTSTDISKELQEAVLSSELKSIFSRASNLIREANGAEGVIFYDASIGSFGGGSEKVVMDQKAPGGFSVDGVASTSEDDQARRPFDTVTCNCAQQAIIPSEKCCNILGYSTWKRSSLRGHAPPDECLRFPETVLRTLLKRYPHGKVFDFDEDGSFSSDSDYTSLCGDTQPGSGPQRIEPSDGKVSSKRISREAEAAAILGALPGARSVFWFPLWDQNRERWYSGSLVWTTCPTRTLCPTEDLTYLAAFGNSIMAEVARLSAQVLSQMKTDFISSISHELRSPLHGVLASVEFLQETPMTEVQADMVNNIHASGKVLLDTINHVLDFSKVNRRSKDKGAGSKKSKRNSRNVGQGRKSSAIAGVDAGDVCVLSEEVIESVYAGRNIGKLVLDASTGRNLAKNRSSFPNPTDSLVTVVVDIGWRPSWTFDVDAGAWRRILMNLFSNALKYTKAGFVKVSLQVEDEFNPRTKSTQPILVLKVKDSGKGISQEFLKYQLYKPFTQEDSLALGAGLGLSIVRHIIQDLAGQIDFTSEQGTGTEAIVRIPLVATNASAEFDGVDFLTEVRERRRGLKFRLEGFDRYPDISETPTGILSAESEAAMFLKSSVQSLMADWFAMEALAPTSLDSSNADVIVLMESGIPSVEEKLQSYNDNRPGDGKTIVIIFGTCSQRSRMVGHDRLQIRYVQQPYGPHKMARILHNAFFQHMAEPQTYSKSQNVSPAAATEPPPCKPTEAPATTSPQSLIYDPLTGNNKPHECTSPEGTAQIPGGMRVLLVEDNEINLKLLVAYMRKLKLDHATAINGLEALNVYKEACGQFDVIFMDISMPVMSGIESTRHIRRYEREEGLHPVALIALTGAANPNTRQEAFSSGVDLFLTKPVPMKELKRMLEDLRRGGRKGLVG